MGNYNSAVITTAGQGLIARAIAGNLPCTLTSAKTTDYVVPGSTSLASLTSLPDIKQSEVITSASVVSNTQVSASVRFSNTDITLNYMINTIGVYAKAGDDTSETLLAVITAIDPDVMPSYSASSPVSYVYDITLTISNASQVNIIVAPTGSPNYSEFNAVKDEVVAARVGSDGVQYSTLEGRLNTEFTDLKSTVYDYETDSITLVSGAWLGTNPLLPTTGLNRIRNQSLLVVNAIKRITLPSAYTMVAYVLDASKTLIQTTTWANTLDTDQFTSGAVYFNLNIRKTATPSADISSDVSTVQSGITVYTRLEKLDDTTIKKVIYVNTTSDVSFIRELYFPNGYTDNLRLGSVRRGYDTGDNNYEWRIVIVDSNGDRAGSWVYRSDTQTDPEPLQMIHTLVPTQKGYVLFDWSKINMGDSISIDYALGYPRLTQAAEDLTLSPILYASMSSASIDMRDYGLNPNRLAYTATKVPVFAWVDDDCSLLGSDDLTAPVGVKGVKAIADSLGIHATYACITSNLSQTGMLDFLLSAQDDGFQITNHSSQHTKDYWYPDSGQPNVNMCRKELIEARNALREAGFVNYDDMILPGGGGSNSTATRKMISEICRSAVLVGSSDGIIHNYGGGSGIFGLKRSMLRDENHNGHTLAQYKEWVDEAIEGGDMIIYGTHSGMSEWNAQLVIDLFTYIISQGYTVVTLNEALLQRMPIFDLFKMFH